MAISCKAKGMPELQSPDFGMRRSNKVSVDRKEKNKRPGMVQNYNLCRKTERKTFRIEREQRNDFVSEYWRENE
jgi:hypothetical protein